MTTNRDILRAAFPQLEISDGYIGNCDFYNNPPRWDDRRWLVFTNLLRPPGPFVGSERGVSIDIPGPEYDTGAVVQQIRWYIDEGCVIDSRVSDRCDARAGGLIRSTGD